MREVEFNTICQAVEDLYIRCCYELDDELVEAFKAAGEAESNPQAKDILAVLVENAAIARDKQIALCQDTGLAVVFIEIGSGVIVKAPADKPDATIIDAVNEGIAGATEKGYLRKSVVAEPLQFRTNTQTNTPAVVHVLPISGDRINISVMAKGGGCENKSQFKMFNPTESRETLIEWISSVAVEAGANACPPFIVGVGLGGNFEGSAILSKKALLRDLSDQHTDTFYAQMENDILKKINASGLGPQGLGGKTTALAVKIETAPCHIASLPVSVNMECHSHRHKSAIL